jgi:hypothetical protein
MVKINKNKPAERLDTPGTLRNAAKSSSGTTGRATFTNADLPDGCHQLWNVYIQQLLDWSGTVPNPWNCRDADIQGNLQAKWDLTYPNIDADIQPKQAIFVRVGVTLIVLQWHL